MSLFVSQQVLWLSDDATPTTPSPRPLASENQRGTALEPNVMGSSGLAKPQLTRPQQTSPDPEFATEVKIGTQSQTAASHADTRVPFPVWPLQGVLRIHLVEAENLIAKDNFMGGMVKGKSDPYVKIRVAGITYRSHTIKENLNPIWNELYEVSHLFNTQVYFSN